jgi:hypothetical protein
MDGKPHHHQKKTKGECTFRVVDDFPLPARVGAAELDAIEAFLMPLVNAIFADSSEVKASGAGADLAALPPDSTPPQKAVSRKR